MKDLVQAEKDVADFAQSKIVQLAVFYPYRDDRHGNYAVMYALMDNGLVYSRAWAAGSWGKWRPDESFEIEGGE